MKQIQLLPLFLIILSLLSSQNSLAAGHSSGGGGGNFFIDETFIPVYVNRNDTNSFTTAPGVATESGLGFDFRTTLGYTFGGTFLVGATYNYYSLSTSQAAIAGGDDGFTDKNVKSEYGPTIGYINNGWRFLFTYFLSGTKQHDQKYVDSTGTATGDTTFKNSKGTGMQLSIGYTFAFGSSFSFGPSLVYKTMTYSAQSKVNRLSSAEDYGDTALYTKNTESTLTPMLSMQFRF